MVFLLDNRSIVLAAAIDLVRIDARLY